MATTQNLGLSLINGSDVVDYNVLNSNFSAIDKVGKDYVVETGVNDRWWYRKWYSGRAEFGVDNWKFNDSVAKFSSWGGNFYHSQDFNFGPLPITITNKAFMQIVLSYCLPDSGSIVVQRGISGSAQIAPPCYLVKPNNMDINECQWSIFGCGRWK